MSFPHRRLLGAGLARPFWMTGRVRLLLVVLVLDFATVDGSGGHIGMNGELRSGTLSAATFAEVFAEGWSLPKPDGFLDFFRPHVHPDATFEQPVFATGRGMEGFKRVFYQLFLQIPDMALEVRNSAWAGDVVFIESRCHGTLGGRPIEFEVCDRLTLADGMIMERRSYSDPLPVLLATARRPRTWPRAVRSLRLAAPATPEPRS